MARQGRPRRQASCLLPGTVPEACPPIGNDEALRLEGFFMACGHRTSWKAVRVERARTAPEHRPYLTESRGKPCWNSSSTSAFPAGTSPSRTSRTKALIHISCDVFQRPRGKRALGGPLARPALPSPSPLVIPLLHSPFPTKKAGQSPAPAFTGKTKGP